MQNFPLLMAYRYDIQSVYEPPLHSIKTRGKPWSAVASGGSASASMANTGLKAATKMMAWRPSSPWRRIEEHSSSLQIFLSSMRKFSLARRLHLYCG